MLALVNGDLFRLTSLDGIAQGVNAEGKMCSGIAVEFRERYPEMHEEYLRTCETAPMAGGLFAYKDEVDNIWIYNCFSQKLAGPNADLKLLKKSLQNMVFHAEINGLERVGLPWIGTGVGALNREDVLEVFEEVLYPSTVEFIVVNYTPDVDPFSVVTKVSLDLAEKVLSEHVLEWRINGYSSEFDHSGDISGVQGWCSCLERVKDYVAHVREEIEKAARA